MSESKHSNQKARRTPLGVRGAGRRAESSAASVAHWLGCHRTAYSLRPSAALLLLNSRSAFQPRPGRLWLRPTASRDLARVHGARAAKHVPARARDSARKRRPPVQASEPRGLGGGSPPAPFAPTPTPLVLATTHFNHHTPTAPPVLCRLPGPLALVQTAGLGSAQQSITHVNGLSLEDVARTCPQVPADAAAAAGHSLGGRLLTGMSRGGVDVRGLAVVVVHASLLAPAGGACDASGAACGTAAAEERRALQRHAARLTWGLAGIVFELMRCRAGHWPALASATDRQYVAGAVLEQLFRCGSEEACRLLGLQALLAPAPALLRLPWDLPFTSPSPPSPPCPPVARPWHGAGSTAAWRWPCCARTTSCVLHRTCLTKCCSRACCPAPARPPPRRRRRHPQRRQRRRRPWAAVRGPLTRQPRRCRPKRAPAAFAAGGGCWSAPAPLPWQPQSHPDDDTQHPLPANTHKLHYASPPDATRAQHSAHTVLTQPLPHLHSSAPPFGSMGWRRAWPPPASPHIVPGFFAARPRLHSPHIVRFVRIPTHTVPSNISSQSSRHKRPCLVCTITRLPCTRACMHPLPARRSLRVPGSIPPAAC